MRGFYHQAEESVDSKMGYLTFSSLWRKKSKESLTLWGDTTEAMYALWQSNRENKSVERERKLT
jgi:hypothetical protein